eukprot:m.60401 g.60401  ORF g.60401 m.60401 type:complete len:387 (+) comp11315_c0_seq4:30-1190(+)
MIQAYRDFARKKKGIKKPNIVVPRTAHPCVYKGCHYLGIKVQIVHEDKITRKANVKEMEKKINKNTICVLGSCPQFPHGVVDPLQDLSTIAVKHNIGLHVDACLGSLLNPFMRAAGFPFPEFDFTLPGVTTISCDTHKYGMGPKGTSMLLFRTQELRRAAYFSYCEWPGGIYGTQAFTGSRSGALSAGCYASMLYYGKEGYLDNTKRIITVAKRAAEGIKKIDGIELIAEPDSAVVCWVSKEFDIYRLGSNFGSERGWDLNTLQMPPAVHIAFTLAHTQEGVIDRFLTDLKECTAEIMKNPKVKADGTSTAIYGSLQTIPDRNLVIDLADVHMDVCLKMPEKGKNKILKEYGNVDIVNQQIQPQQQQVYSKKKPKPTPMIKHVTIL